MSSESLTIYVGVLSKTNDSIPEDVIDAANLNLVKNTAINLSISPTEIIETFYTPLSKRQSKPSSRTRSRGLSSFNSEEDKDKETQKDSPEKKNSSEI